MIPTRHFGTWFVDCLAWKGYALDGSAASLENEYSEDTSIGLLFRINTCISGRCGSHQGADCSSVDRMG